MEQENFMTRKGKVFAGAAVLLALGSAAAVAHRHGGWHHRGHHGWGGLQMGGSGPIGRVCRGDLAEKADHMLVRIEHRVKPTDAQKPAFEELKTAMKSAAAKVEASCPTPPARTAEGSDQKPSRKEITARLAETEVQLAAVLDGLKIVRPAAEKFYASLDDAQKEAVSFMGRGKHGKWGMHHHRRGEGRGPGRMMDRGSDRGQDGDGSVERESDL